MRLSSVGHRPEGLFVVIQANCDVLGFMLRWWIWDPAVASFSKMENLSRPGWWFEGRKDGQPSAQPWNPQLTLYFHPSFFTIRIPRNLYRNRLFCYWLVFCAVIFLTNCVLDGGLGLKENPFIVFVVRFRMCVTTSCLPTWAFPGRSGFSWHRPPPPLPPPSRKLNPGISSGSVSISCLCLPYMNI